MLRLGAALTPALLLAASPASAVSATHVLAMDGVLAPAQLIGLAVLALGWMRRHRLRAN